MTESPPRHRGDRIFGRPRDEAEFQRRQRLAAQALLIAGLVAALSSPRIGIASLLAGILLLGAGAAAWWRPSSGSSRVGLLFSVAWFGWASWWHLARSLANNTGPTIDALPFLINLAPALFALLSSIYCASSMARPLQAEHHAA